MSCTDRKSWSGFPSLGFISGCVLLISGCSIVELDKLVPSTAIDFVSSDSNLLQYVPNACPNSVVAKIFENHMKLRSGVSNVQRSLPAELAQDPVVTTLINHSHYVSARAVQTAYTVIKNAPPAPITDVSKPPSNVGPIDIYRFGRLVTDHVWRRTPSTQPASSPDPVAEQFWNNLKAYYEVYFQDNFNNYLGVHLPAPSPSLTISDAEIVQTVQVFIEFLLDEIFHSPIWTSKDSSDKNIYPGGTASRPTYVVVNKITPQPISATLPGCGMNVPKAKAIAYLVRQFSTAASAEVGLVVKSAGSIEIGLGILGKVNIGDNNLLSELVKGVATEVVSRLTVQLAVPILSAIDFEQQPDIVAKVQMPLAMAGGPKSTTAQKAAQLRTLISPFVSANIKPL